MKMLRWLHRWLGIGLGIFVAIVGLTGSWLVFERELAPDFQLSVASEPLPLQELYDRARSHLPAETKVSLRFPSKPELPYQIWTSEKRLVINQYTGEVLAVRPVEYWTYGWMFYLHTELLLGKTGKTVGGWLGIGVLLIVVVGVVLWWPKKWNSALQLRRKHGEIIFWRDLHKQAGALVTPLLLLAVITGVSLSFSEWIRDTTNHILGYENAQDAIKPEPIYGTGPAPIDTLAKRADEAMPGGRIGLLIMPATPAEPVIVRKQMPQDPHPNGLNFVYLHPITAEVLKVIPLKEAEPARRWFNWAYPLHTGQALQPWHHWILMLVGVLPLLLFLSGGYLYLLRKRKLRRI